MVAVLTVVIIGKWYVQVIVEVRCDWRWREGGKGNVGEGVNVVIEIMEEVMVVIRFCFSSKRNEEEEEEEETQKE